MKYLKKFNEANNEEDIDDILLEIEDMGATIKHRIDRQYPNIHFINIFLHKEVEKEPIDSNDLNIWEEVKCLDWEDIKDCLLRLKDYLGKNFREFRVVIYEELFMAGTKDYKLIELTNRTKIKGSVYEVRIEYAKVY